MSELNLQLNLFEETTTSIEVAEIDGSEVGGIMRYYDLRKSRDMEIETCAGDVTVIINALEDYARMLEMVVKEWKLEGAHGFLYELHAARCRKISAKYQRATGYNYGAAIEKCRKRREDKKDDVGEEALTLMAKYGRKTDTKGGEAPAAVDTEPAQFNQIALSFTTNT